MKIRFALFICSLLFLPALILGSCSDGTSTSITDPKESQTPIPSATPAAVDPTPASQVKKLVVWLPDSLLATNRDVIIKRIKQQSDKFTASHPEIDVEIRLKKVDSTINLVDTLQSTSLAAPGSLPDLVLLTNEEMEVAALKGLLYPLDEISDLLDSKDWAPAVRDLSAIEDSTFGLPVIGDATVLVSKIGSPIDISIYKIDHPILTFLNDPKGLLMIGLYYSAGGELSGGPAHLNLDQQALQASFEVINSSFATKAFSSSTMQYGNSSAALKEYTTGKGDQWIGWYSELPASVYSDTIAPVPGLDDASASLARGWFWTLAGTDQTRRRTAAELAETFSEAEFLSDLAVATHLMPVRESKLMDYDLELASRYHILQGSHPIPDGVLLVTIGPTLNDAVIEISNGKVTPADLAAKIAIRK